MELPEYYQIVNKALQGDKEAQKKWGECQVEMIPKHVAFHSNKKASSKDKAAEKAAKAAEKVAEKAAKADKKPADGVISKLIGRVKASKDKDKK